MNPFTVIHYTNKWYVKTLFILIVITLISGLISLFI
jgi:hypothetical protein